MLEVGGKQTNAIIVNEDGLIVDVLRPVSGRVNRVRELLPGKALCSSADLRALRGRRAVDVAPGRGRRLTQRLLAREDAGYERVAGRRDRPSLRDQPRYAGGWTDRRAEKGPGRRVRQYRRVAGTVETRRLLVRCVSAALSAGRQARSL